MANTLAGVCKVASVSQGNGAGAANIVSWDIASLGLGLVNANDVSLAVKGTLVGRNASAGGYGRIELIADFKRTSGTLSQIGTTSVQYTAFDAALAGATGTIDANGTSIRLREDNTAVAVTVVWTGYLWIYSSQY